MLVAKTLFGIIILVLQVVVIVEAKSVYPRVHQNGTSGSPISPWLRKVVVDQREPGCSKRPWICKEGEDPPRVRRMCCKNQCIEGPCLLSHFHLNRLFLLVHRNRLFLLNLLFHRNRLVLLFHFRLNPLVLLFLFHLNRLVLLFLFLLNHLVLLFHFRLNPLVLLFLFLLNRLVLLFHFRLNHLILLFLFHLNRLFLHFRLNHLTFLPLKRWREVCHTGQVEDKSFPPLSLYVYLLESFSYLDGMEYGYYNNVIALDFVKFIA
ncbi:hypothetical protein RHGRI_016484 [Rhododendron griersonianum]|uniref:Uncharacterized protein n=1 Tax=Rhododendron griersonianum TaxID=479676 RepID=A0AAV6JU97_9ERIC|nr:hypothetical protein RHGRI_016484 [Rhododendron griersonianum]